MSTNPARTALGAVRGLGSAREGAEHWGEERLVSLGSFALLVWLGVSLLRLPDFGHGTLSQWLSAPLAATPMLLLVLVLFRHIQLGLTVFVEDYVHSEGGRLFWRVLINFSCLFAGTLAAVSVLKLAIAGGAAGA
jgi:succinate dehydrogenase / fumarate reductase membrane anchor subunit